MGRIRLIFLSEDAATRYLEIPLAFLIDVLNPFPNLP
jgi:hypothetical protein